MRLRRLSTVLGPARTLDLEIFKLPLLDFDLGIRDYQAEYSGDELRHRPLAALGMAARPMSCRQAGRT